MTFDTSQSSPPNSHTSGSTSPGHTVYTPASDDPRQTESLATQSVSRGPSPLRSVTFGATAVPTHRRSISSDVHSQGKDWDNDFSGGDHEEEEEATMDTRPPFHWPSDGRSQVPLLKDEPGRSTFSEPNGRPTFTTRRSTFRNRSPDMEASAAAATKKKYIYASFFLALSLVAFVVQTETAKYIQNQLGWKKPYAMLYLTHGSWSILWPAQLLILRLRSWKSPWGPFWRRHQHTVRTTAQMVVSQDLHLRSKEANKSPMGYMLRKTALVTTALTVAGASWYYAVGMTSPSDLTAIYNCSAFFAYAFSIPLLGDKLRFDKIFAVAVAIAGVMTIAYGDSKQAEKGGSAEEANNRTAGNIIIGVGSVLYGLYEVLYKKMACPPEGVSPSRGAIFANTFGSLIGCFTLLVLWLPVPILHFTGLEVFEWPPGKARWMLFISTFSNAVLVVIADYFRTGDPLSAAAIVGGLLIMGAFFLLSWSTYREMEEERKKHREMLLTQTGKPRVILGLMTFGPDEAAGARITSLDEYNRCLDHFQREGYNEVDTARTYIGGKQEAFTKEARWQERGLALATKCYPRPAGTHRPAVLKEQFSTSLAELGADCVDIFYLHAADRSVPFAETLEAVNELHKDGKFVQLGISNFTAFEVAEVVMTCKANGWVRPTIYQGVYNAITRTLEPELIPCCHRYGIDVVIYNPLAGGLFSGKIKSAEVPQEGRYSKKVSYGELYRKRYFRDATFDALRLIEQIAQKHNLTLLEIALRWCVHHSALKMKDGGRDGVIIGVSSFSQLESNLKDLEKGPLPDEVVQTLDDAWMITKATTPNYWQLDLEYTYDTQQALFKPKA
ncbi:MAG: hypothetical protein LQ345_004727 [Seirophora villosa]|nr:MAG: hypothetical protein LQ345_004727 [Seirophora villosa]